jgi:arylmalonate decarboxylase
VVGGRWSVVIFKTRHHTSDDGFVFLAVMEQTLFSPMEGPMRHSRREFLRAINFAAAYAALGGGAASAAANPTLGLIFPPENYPIPPDAKLLFPSGVDFVGNGVGLPGGMTIEGYEEAIPRVLPRARELAQQGAGVVSVFGSSLTFYKGAKFHDDLIGQVAKATGRKATTQSNGLLDGLRTANARRIAVATAYTDVVTERLKIFLQEYGFEVTSAKGLGFEKIPDGAATHDILFKLSTDAYANSRKADALVVSCGALRTLDLIVPVENAIKVPVVSSTPHGLWHGVKMLGVNARVQGFGMVMAKR